MRFPYKLLYLAFAGYLIFSLAEEGCNCDCTFDGGGFERFPPRNTSIDYEELEQKCLDNTSYSIL